MTGWIIAGLILGAVALKYFWEDTARWLNNTAANAVERRFGIDARKNMQRAISRVSRVMDKIDNVTRIFLRTGVKGQLQQIDLRATAPIYEQEEDVIKELERQKILTNEFIYKG